VKSGKSIYVYTPSIDGMISGDTHDSIIRLITSGNPVRAIFDKTNHDLVRARGRAVARFLETDFTHMLFVDSDVGFHPQAVEGMLATGMDVVSTPYPKKRLMLSRFRDAIRDKNPHATALLHEWGFRRLSIITEVEGDTVEVEGVPLGLTLISRACLERMAEFYKDLSFADLPDMGDSGNRARECPGIFQLILNKRWLMPEDFSFCKRWRDMGGKIYIYIGDCSPATHWGAYRYSSEVGE
jgi:hypothetical protein